MRSCPMHAVRDLENGAKRRCFLANQSQAAAYSQQPPPDPRPAGTIPWDYEKQPSVGCNPPRIRYFAIAAQ